MKLDEKDLKLIDILYKAEEVEEAEKQGDNVQGYTISYLAREVFDPDSRSDIQSLDPKVRNRLNKLERYGIVDLDDEGTNTYTLRSDKIIYSNKARIELATDITGEEKVYEFDSETLQGLLFVENDEGLYISGFVPTD